MLATVVSCRKYSDQGSSCKTLEPIHDAPVGSHNHVKAVFGQERFDTVGSEFDDITCLRWVTKMVSINAELAVSVSWIRP